MELLEENLLRRIDRHKEDILKFLFTTDVPFDNNLAKESTEDVQNSGTGSANVRVSLLFWNLFSSLFIKRRKK
jgi:hypothetical protein